MFFFKFMFEYECIGIVCPGEENSEVALRHLYASLLLNIYVDIVVKVLVLIRYSETVLPYNCSSDM